MGGAGCVCRLHVLVRFHALDDNHRHGAGGEPHEMIEAAAPVLAAQDAMREGCIDLDDIDGHVEQAGRRGITGAEIIDRDPASGSPRRLEKLMRGRAKWSGAVSVISRISRAALMRWRKMISINRAQ